jgi:hypothetical protein
VKKGYTNEGNISSFFRTVNKGKRQLHRVTIGGNTIKLRKGTNSNKIILVRLQPHGGGHADIAIHTVGTFNWMDGKKNSQYV